MSVSKLFRYWTLVVKIPWTITRVWDQGPIARISTKINSAVQGQCRRQGAPLLLRRTIADKTSASIAEHAELRNTTGVGGYSSRAKKRVVSYPNRTHPDSKSR